MKIASNEVSCANLNWTDRIEVHHHIVKKKNVTYTLGFQVSRSLNKYLGPDKSHLKPENLQPSFVGTVHSTLTFEETIFSTLYKQYCHNPLRGKSSVTRQ